VHQSGNQLRLYYDARSTNHQELRESGRRLKIQTFLFLTYVTSCIKTNTEVSENNEEMTVTVEQM